MTLTTHSANRKDVNTAKHGVTLEHRHFSFIAGVIASLPDEAIKTAVAQYFAEACDRSNPRFDRDRFFRACYAKER